MEKRTTGYYALGNTATSKTETTKIMVPRAEAVTSLTVLPSGSRRVRSKAQIASPSGWGEDSVSTIRSLEFESIFLTPPSCQPDMSTAPNFTLDMPSRKSILSSSMRSLSKGTREAWPSHSTNTPQRRRRSLGDGHTGLEAEQKSGNLRHYRLRRHHRDSQSTVASTLTSSDRHRHRHTLDNARTPSTTTANNKQQKGLRDESFVIKLADLAEESALGERASSNSALLKVKKNSRPRRKSECTLPVLNADGELKTPYIEDILKSAARLKPPAVSSCHSWERANFTGPGFASLPASLARSPTTTLLLPLIRDAEVSPKVDRDPIPVPTVPRVDTSHNDVKRESIQKTNSRAKKLLLDRFFGENQRRGSMDTRELCGSGTRRARLHRSRYRRRAPSSGEDTTTETVSTVANHSGTMDDNSTHADSGEGKKNKRLRHRLAKISVIQSSDKRAVRQRRRSASEVRVDSSIVTALTPSSAQPEESLKRHHHHYHYHILSSLRRSDSAQSQLPVDQAHLDSSATLDRQASGSQRFSFTVDGKALTKRALSVFGIGNRGFLNRQHKKRPNSEGEDSSELSLEGPDSKEYMGNLLDYDRPPLGDEEKRKAISAQRLSKFLIRSDLDKFDEAYAKNDIPALVGLIKSNETFEYASGDYLHPWATPPRTIGALAMTQIAALASTEDQAVKERIRASGAIPILVKQLASSEEDREDAALVALSFLSIDFPRACVEMCQEGIFPYLVPLFRNKKNGVKGAAAQTARNIYVLEARYRREFGECGGCQALVDLLLLPNDASASTPLDLQTEAIYHLDDYIIFNGEEISDCIAATKICNVARKLQLLEEHAEMVGQDALKDAARQLYLRLAE